MKAEIKETISRVQKQLKRLNEYISDLKKMRFLDVQEELEVIEGVRDLLETELARFNSLIITLQKHPKDRRIEDRRVDKPHQSM